MRSCWGERGRNTDFVLICSVMFLSEQVSALLRSLFWVQRDSHINVIICSVTIIVPHITAAFQSVTHIWVMTVQPCHLINCKNITSWEKKSNFLFNALTLKVSSCTLKVFFINLHQCNETTYQSRINFDHYNHKTTDISKKNYTAERMSIL